MSESSSISFNNYTFEVVTQIPVGYEIWTQKDAAPQGYLPLCKMLFGSKIVDTKSLKAIQTEHAEKILVAASGGCTTIASMQNYIAKNRKVAPGSWEDFKVKAIREAYPFMRKLAKEQIEQSKKDHLQERKESAGTNKSLRNALFVLKHVQPNPKSLQKSNLSQHSWENAVFTAITALEKQMNDCYPKPIDFNKVKANSLIGQPVCIRFLIDGEPSKDAPSSRWVIIDDINFKQQEVTVSHIGILPLSENGKAWEMYYTYVSNYRITKKPAAKERSPSLETEEEEGGQ